MAEGGGKPDQYQKGDRCFAKLKGYPPWPAQVQERVQGKEEKYFLHFYGTHDSAQVKVQNIYPYDEKHISKYGKPAKPSPAFKKAMDEMEANVELYAATEDADALPAVKEDVEEEGSLQIDETPPPVLKREGKITAPRSAPKEPAPKAPARRLSKSSKRDSISATNSGVSSPVTETPPPAPAPQPEIVSRSGRKIKPKRFADDEIGSPVTSLAKAALQSSIDEGKAEPSPSAPKRSKKQKSIGGVSPAPALTPEQPVTAPAKPKESFEPKSRGKRSVPKLQPAEAAAPPPAPTPAPAPTKSKVSPTVLNTPKTEEESPELSPEIESDSNSAPVLTKAEFAAEVATEAEPREEIDDKENSTSSWTNNAQDEDVVSDDSSESKTEMKNLSEASVELDESSGESMKVTLGVKKDTEVLLIYNHDRPKEFPSQKVRLEWDLATAKNALKIRETLESTDPTAVELFNLLAAAVEQKESELIDIVEKAMSEKRRIKLQKLRVEGEVIEIIGDVINCLSAGAADCDRAIELLERLKNHDLSALILKKHPEIVETVRKLRYYEGNAEEWGLSPDQAEEFDEKTAIIRDKACKIYESFKVTFGCTPEKSFENEYLEELQRFREYCSTLSKKEYLNLTEEPTSVAGETGTAEELDAEEQQAYEARGRVNGGGRTVEGDQEDSSQEGGGEDEGQGDNEVEMESDQGESSRNFESEADG